MAATATVEGAGITSQANGSQTISINHAYIGRPRFAEQERGHAIRFSSLNRTTEMVERHKNIHAVESVVLP